MEKNTCCRNYFTFHDVSINTRHPIGLTTVPYFSLHSTMFLLIRENTDMPSRGKLFTFHDVSINTKSVSHQRYKNSNFTFHDVSINTAFRCFQVIAFFPLHSTMFLLIPVVYSSLQYRYNLTTFCQSCHFIILYLFLSFWTALIFEIFLISQALSTS